MQDELTKKDFDYLLPSELIAQEPLPERDHARLLVRKTNGNLEHHQVKDLTELLPNGSLIVVNNSRVVPCRLYGQVEGLRTKESLVEIFLLTLPDQISMNCRALGKPLRKIEKGTVIRFPGGLTAEVLDKPNDVLERGMVIRFNLSANKVLEWLEHNARMPLPPYIKRNKSKDQDTHADLDQYRYQTVYAKSKGSVAAPTAGLHFSENLLAELAKREIRVESLSLHVGAGTFMPLRHEHLDRHVMHEEQFFVPRTTFQNIISTKEQKLPVVVVGTTTFRALESLYQVYCKSDILKAKQYCDQWLTTDLFIYPKNRDDRYKSWCAQALMTNFHQPESTLVMLVAGLIGYAGFQEVYREAVAEKYRFFSYGDTSLLWL